MQNAITIKRAYEPPMEYDGKRILIDRLWPRGITKERLNVDIWMKEVAPSSDLRRWFGHSPERFNVFSKQYVEQLMTEGHGYIEQLIRFSEQSLLTLVYAAKDPVHNHAVVLKRYIEEQISHNSTYV